MDETPWPVIASEVEYDTGWYTGGYDRVEQPDGSQKDYYWAALAPAVVVVPITDNKEVVFVRQYRPTIQESQYELPAGIVDEHDGRAIDTVPADTYEAAARRELREETGYTADRVTTIQRHAVATGVLRHRRGIVVAEGLDPGPTDRDQNEFLSVERVPAADAIKTARAAPANDATIGGLLLAAADGYVPQNEDQTTL